MENQKFTNSVHLNKDACVGCINCIKYCPTQAIRVHDGKASITPEFCIDCGRCIRYCPHHAKVPDYDSIADIVDYKYTVVLPAPSLYAQYNNVTDVDLILNALLELGFDDVFEVSAAAELVSEYSRKYIAEHEEGAPFISSACPSIVRLIRVKFPTLIPRILPLKPPVEVAAEIARKRAVKKTGLAPEEIGIFFISPCPSKVSYVKSPLGVEKSQIDRVLAMKDIYPLLLREMKNIAAKPLRPLSASGRIGIGWSNTGGESAGLLTEHYLAADGIMSALRVLSDLEDEKYHGLKFIELNSCAGGCVGGTLTVENPYIATAKNKQLHRYLPVSVSHTDSYPDANFNWSDTVEYEPVFRLGKNFRDSFEKMGLVEELVSQLPGLDCGSCGAPTCRALAEDVVRGKATMNDCIYERNDYLHGLAMEISLLADSLTPGSEEQKKLLDTLTNDINILEAELKRKDR